jgi:hypothetical protein
VCLESERQKTQRPDRRSMGVRGTMRLLLAATLALASAITSSAQAPTRIRDVAKLFEMRTFRGETYPVFNYQGVWVSGDVSLKDYNDATGVVRRELRAAEEIIEVIASQQVPLERQWGKDLIVRTCIGWCGKGGGPEVTLPDGRKGVSVSSSGRFFVFERVADTLKLASTSGWIE